MTAVTVLTTLFLGPIIVVTAFFAVEMLFGIRRLPPVKKAAPQVRAVIVVPAHDEEAMIRATVGHLHGPSTGGWSVLVVADNCSDRTAELASEAGAEVIIRNEPRLGGKGYALAAARDHLRPDPPDVVIIADADCRLDRNSIQELANAGASTGRACQALNLLEPDLGASAMVQISTFAFLIKNVIRQRGLQRLAGRVHLTGTGMALPWPVFEFANLGGSNIVEDLALGLELSKRSSPPLLVEDATVWSPPASTSGTLVQRQRWEGGYLATSLANAPGLLAKSVRSLDGRAFCAALDLCVPPLALLFMLNGVGVLLGLLAVAIGGSPWLAWILFFVGLIASIILLVAWSREGRSFIASGTLLRLPLYVLWKIPLYIGLARKGAPKDWLRTGR